MLGSRLCLRYRWDSVSSLCQRSDFFILWGFFIFGAAPCLALTPASAQGWLVGVLFLVNPHRTWNVLWELQRSPVLGSLLSQGRVWGIWAAQGCCVLLVSPVWAAATPELTQGNFPEGFPVKPRHKCAFVRVLHFVQDAQWYLLIFYWLLPNKWVENLTLSFTF